MKHLRLQARSISVSRTSFPFSLCNVRRNEQTQGNIKKIVKACNKSARSASIKIERGFSMTQKEQLWEKYEDAVFAILMDAVAEQEGKRGLQLMEELEQDPSAQVPEEVQRRPRQPGE